MIPLINYVLLILITDRGSGNNVLPVPHPSPSTTDGGTSREEGEAPDVPAGVSAAAVVGEDGISR